MVCGTSSDAGKSTVTTGLCRLLARRGVAVAPFKGQNMSLNAMVTAAGGEMGRAQWVQSIAAGAEPEVAMNPVLLKPTGERTSQVVVMGRPAGVREAGDYQASKRSLVGVVDAALGLAAGPLRRRRLRGRRQPGRDQPAGRRHREPRPGPPGRDPRRRGGGHRAGRRVRAPLGHGGDPARRAVLARRGLRHQPLPRRPGAPGHGGGRAGGAVRHPHPRGAAPPRGPRPRRRGFAGPGAALRAARRAVRRRARRGGDPPAPPVQLHRPRPPGRRAGRARPLGRRPRCAGRPGPGGDRRDPGHGGRPALAARERPRPRARRPAPGPDATGDPRHLRRVPDDGPGAARPRRRRVRRARVPRGWAGCPWTRSSRRTSSPA